MKSILMIFSLIFSSQFCVAGPSISGGIPPHPALTTMSLERPVAGIDYPTDSSTRIKKMLVLFDGRIGITKNVRLEKARAGEDFPTDSAAPMCTQYQKVLVFGRHLRIPVLISFENQESFWSISAELKVKVSEISSIESAVAGIDYPTDGPADLFRPALFVVMKDEQRLVIR